MNMKPAAMADNSISAKIAMNNAMPFSFFLADMMAVFISSPLFIRNAGRCSHGYGCIGPGYRVDLPADGVHGDANRLDVRNDRGRAEVYPAGVKVTEDGISFV